MQDGHEPLHGLRLRGNLRQYRTIPALRLQHRSGGCRTSLAVSALRIMRYCLNILKAAEKVGNKKNPTARKQLDISIKRTLKIGHRLCRFCAIQQRKKLRQYLCHSFLVGAGGFASRGLKNSPQDCFLPSADGRPVRILPAPAQKRTRNLSCGSFLVGAGGFEPPKH